MSPLPGARLTIDLGNSRCKFRVWEADRDTVLYRFDCPVDDGLVSAADSWLNETNRPLRAAMCAVADRQVEERLAGLLRQRGIEFEQQLDHELEIDCDQPETVGRDRLFAARGALEITGRSSIVVDCGTALTVDLVLERPRGEPGRIGKFAGGAIAPGPQLLSEALARGGARLPKVNPKPGVPALGRHTRAALEAGIAVGLRGAARELIRGLAAVVPDLELPVVLTGGAREFLLTGEALAREVSEEPDLVSLGLLAAMGSSGRFE